MRTCSASFRRRSSGYHPPGLGMETTRSWADRRQSVGDVGSRALRAPSPRERDSPARAALPRRRNIDGRRSQVVRVANDDLTGTGNPRGQGGIGNLIAATSRTAAPSNRTGSIRPAGDPAGRRSSKPAVLGAGPPLAVERRDSPGPWSPWRSLSRIGRLAVTATSGRRRKPPHEVLPGLGAASPRPGAREGCRPNREDTVKQGQTRRGPLRGEVASYIQESHQVFC